MTGEKRLMSSRISGGKDRGRRLQVPKSRLRPTTEKVRAAIFSILGGQVDGARVLDLYAGTGAMGLEALSRGAESADFVEGDARACSTINTNIRSLGYDDLARVIRARAEKAVASPATLLGSSTAGQNCLPYDLVFIDPPYDDDPWDDIMTGLSDGTLLRQDVTVVAEHGSSRTLAGVYGRLSLQRTRRYGGSSISIYTLSIHTGSIHTGAVANG